MKPTINREQIEQWIAYNVTSNKKHRSYEFCDMTLPEQLKLINGLHIVFGFTPRNLAILIAYVLTSDNSYKDVLDAIHQLPDGQIKNIFKTYFGV